MSPDIFIGSADGIKTPRVRHLPQYLEQARIALDNAMEKGIPLSFCSDCAISYTRNPVLKNQDVNLEHPVLRQIRHYDETRGTQYYETLRCYVMEERSVTRTAQALHIHKNTLLYRMGRLQELFPLDLSEKEERLRLILSFMLYS